jgi:hypothetical protein
VLDDGTQGDGPTTVVGDFLDGVLAGGGTASK